MLFNWVLNCQVTGVTSDMSGLQENLIEMLRFCNEVHLHDHTRGKIDQDSTLDH